MGDQGHKDYSHVPLTKKLGIKEEATFLLVDPPEGFLEYLGPLPAGVELVEDVSSYDVALAFFTHEMEFQRRLDVLVAGIAPAGGLWIAWPKKTSKIRFDLTFEFIQVRGLKSGLVDNKSCAIDQAWQALRFVVRRENRKR